MLEFWWLERALAEVRVYGFRDSWVVLGFYRLINRSGLPKDDFGTDLEGCSEDDFGTDLEGCSEGERV